MSDCLFCKVIAWEIPSAPIWEDENYYAFLDLFPNCYGQTLVIPKKHYDSQVFEMWNIEYSELLLASKNVSIILKISLQVERVWMIMEWMWVNHAHIKLYPMHGLESTWTANESSTWEYFETYPGHLTTKPWEMLTSEKLQSIQKNILNNKNV